MKKVFEIECLTVNNNENIIRLDECYPFGGECWPIFGDSDDCAPDCYPSE